MAYENIQVSREGPVTTLTVNRPKALNALNSATLRELLQAVREAAESCRALILTGAGEKAFVAGADISELARQTPLQARPLALRGQKLMNTVESCPKPVVAAVNGFAFGGGFELALACHLRTASPNAVMGLPEVTLGIIPGYGGTQRLPRLVGKGRALEMILTAARVDAAEALRIGLIERMVPAGEAQKAARELALTLAAKAPVALRYAKEAVVKGLALPLEDGVRLEGDLSTFLRTTEDRLEGAKAFLEKRKPRWQGR